MGKLRISDGIDVHYGSITAKGGIDGLDISNGISGSNFNISGVNALTINDPGEGIIFGGGSTTVTLYAIDDSTDSIMNFSNASELRVNNNKVWTVSNDGASSGLDADLLDGQHGSHYLDYNNFTNTPTIPSLSGYATESYVNTQVSNLVDSAPGTLNTLNELAAALGDDASFSTTVTNSIATNT